MRRPPLHASPAHVAPSREAGLRRGACALLALLLGGCAGTQPADGPRSAGAVAPGFQQVTLAPPPEQVPAPGPRQQAMFDVMLAEIAGHRGQVDEALRTYMSLLRGYPRDGRLAERVTRVALYAAAEEEAMEAARLWAAAEPEALEPRQLMAGLALQKGDLEAAQGHFEFVLDAPSGDPGAKLRALFNFLGAAPDPEAALSLMGRLVEGRAEDPDMLFAYAMLAVRAGNMPEARRAMERVLTLTPDSTGMALSYLGILQKQGDMAAAETWLESVLARRPEDFELRLVYARLLADSRRYGPAMREFERLEQARPGNGDVQYALGLLQLQANAPDRARQHFERLLELGGNDADASFYLGQIAEFQGRPEAALAHYRAVDVGEFRFDAQLRVAGLLAAGGRVDEALAHLHMLASAEPQLATRAIRAEGELLIELGRPADAMAVYDAALQNSYDPDLLYSRAMLAEQMGRLDVLERDLKTILEQDPDNAQALNALGYTLADRTERFEEAHELILKALHLSPQDFYILDSMGWVLYRMGRYDEALEYLRRAQALRDDPEVAAHIVQVLWAQGARARARETFEAAGRRFPADPRLRELGQRLGL